MNGKWIGLVDDIASQSRLNVKLVGVSGFDVGNESFPNAGLAARVESVRDPVPVVETAYDGDSFGIGSPDVEPGALLAFMGAEMAPEVVIKTKVTSFVEQIQIVIAEE